MNSFLKEVIYLLFIIWFAGVFLGIPFLYIENTYLTKYEATSLGRRLNRGYKIHQRPLSKSELTFLEKLDADIVEKRFYKDLFIQVQQSERLIYGYSSYKTFIPFVGYVNFEAQEVIIEYRTVIFGHYLLLPFILGFPPLGLLMAYGNFRKTTRDIDKFLTRCIKTYGKI